jgi:hypothetical protein
VYAQKSNDAAASSAAAYTQRRLSYCAFFRNDPAPRAIALTISMPEAFTDFNSARRMRPHCERSVCISSLGTCMGSRSGRAAIKNVHLTEYEVECLIRGLGQADSSWGERACTHKKAPFTGTFCFAHLSEPQSARGNSKLFVYIMSRCSNRIGSSAASIRWSRLSKAARVLGSILHCADESGPNIAVKVAL